MGECFNANTHSGIRFLFSRAVGRHHLDCAICGWSGFLSRLLLVPLVRCDNVLLEGLSERTLVSFGVDLPSFRRNRFV
jgi:hypothetical protein